MDYLDENKRSSLALPTTWPPSALDSNFAANAVFAMAQCNKHRLYARSVDRIMTPGLNGLVTRLVIVREIEIILE